MAENDTLFDDHIRVLVVFVHPSFSCEDQLTKGSLAVRVHTTVHASRMLLAGFTNVRYEFTLPIYVPHPPYRLSAEGACDFVIALGKILLPSPPSPDPRHFCAMVRVVVRALPY